MAENLTGAPKVDISSDWASNNKSKVWRTNNENYKNLSNKISRSFSNGNYKATPIKRVEYLMAHLTVNLKFVSKLFILKIDTKVAQLSCFGRIDKISDLRRKCPGFGRIDKNSYIRRNFGNDSTEKLKIVSNKNTSFIIDMTELFKYVGLIEILMRYLCFGRIDTFVRHSCFGRIHNKIKSSEKAPRGV